MDSKAKYSALSSTRRRKNIIIKKKKLKQTNASAPLIQYRFRSLKAVRKEIRVTMEKGRGNDE